MQLLGGKFCIRLHQVVSSVEAPHSRLDSSSGPKHRSKRFLAQVRQCLGWGGHQHRNALSRGFKYTQTLGWVLGEHWYPSCAKHQGQRQVIVGGSNSQLYTEVVSSTLILRSFVSDVSRLTIFFFVAFSGSWDVNTAMWFRQQRSHLETVHLHQLSTQEATCSTMLSKIEGFHYLRSAVTFLLSSIACPHKHLFLWKTRWAMSNLAGDKYTLHRYNESKVLKKIQAYTPYQP